MESRRRRRRKVFIYKLIIICFAVGFATIFLLFQIKGGFGRMEAVKVQADNENIIDIEGLSQKNIPTGCEAVSAVMVLNYYGVDITPEEFINAYLPKEQFYYIGNTLYGPNPEEKFAGDPFKKSSLGCYPPVIVQAIENMKADGYEGSLDITANILQEKSLDTICEEYIKKQIPVLLWVTMDMCEPREGFRYVLEDGTEYTWTAGEHCMVLCGFDEEYYYLKDPLAEGKTVKYKKELVEKRYGQMGSRGLAVISNHILRWG